MRYGARREAPAGGGQRYAAPQRAEPQEPPAELSWDYLVNVQGWTWLPPFFEPPTDSQLAKAEALGVPAALLLQLQQQKQQDVKDNVSLLWPHAWGVFVQGARGESPISWCEPGSCPRCASRAARDGPARWLCSLLSPAACPLACRRSP